MSPAKHRKKERQLWPKGRLFDEEPCTVKENKKRKGEEMPTVHKAKKKSKLNL